MRTSTLAWREGEALLKRSKPWRGGPSAWLSHGWRYFSISFHFSEDVQTKISATYVEVKVCISTGTGENGFAVNEPVNMQHKRENWKLFWHLQT